MSFIKILLIGFGLILFGMLAFSIVGFIYSAFWYLFWIGLVALGGYAGYKLLSKESKTSLLEDKSTFSIAGTENVNQAFEDFKRKYLTK